MADPLKKVKPGENVTFGAEAWNAFVDAARDFKQRRQFGVGEKADDLRNPAIIKVRNISGDAVGYNAVLSIDGQAPLILPSNNLSEFRRQTMMEGAAPAGAGEIFCVTKEPIPDGKIGRAYVAGAVSVQIDVSDEAHTFATTEAANTDTLVSSADTGAPILWKESGTGTVWALILLPVGGGSSASVFAIKLVDGVAGDGGRYDALLQIAPNTDDPGLSYADGASIWALSVDGDSPTQLAGAKFQDAVFVGNVEGRDAYAFKPVLGQANLIITGTEPYIGAGSSGAFCYACNIESYDPETDMFTVVGSGLARERNMKKLPYGLRIEGKFEGNKDSVGRYLVDYCCGEVGTITVDCCEEPIPVVLTCTLDAGAGCLDELVIPLTYSEDTLLDLPGWEGSVLACDGCTVTATFVCDGLSFYFQLDCNGDNHLNGVLGLVCDPFSCTSSVGFTGAENCGTWSVTATITG